MNPAPNATKKEVTITRTFDAPRDIVFRAWTDAKQLAQWWGPAGWTNPVCEVDPRPGGAIHIVMRGPEPWGDNPLTGVFREVARPERLVFTTTPLDKDGKAFFEILTTVTFEDDQGKTRLTMHQVELWSKPEAASSLAGMEEGTRQTLERLGAFLAP